MHEIFGIVIATSIFLLSCWICYLEGKRARLRLDHNNLIQLMKCPTCDDQDFNDNHPCCLTCAILAIRELRVIVPEHVWKMGAQAYAWADHFERIYIGKHSLHQVMKLHEIKKQELL